MKQKFEANAILRVIGMDCLADELVEAGFRVDGAQQPDEYLGNRTIDIDLFNEYPIKKDVSAVVVGLDENFDYAKLCLACLYIQTGSKFVCTND